MEPTLRPLCALSLAWLAGLLLAGATHAGSWQAPLALASFVLATVIAAQAYASSDETPPQSAGADLLNEARSFGRGTLAWLALAAFAAGIAGGPQPLALAAS